METNTSVADLLREELVRRKQTNANYSLRSFARSLGISSSFLSKLITGKRSISEENLFKIASRLKLPEDFTDSLATARTQKSKVPNYEVIKADQFRLIADWHHYAILECVSLQGFEPSAQWIAGRLPISEDKAQTALDRLLRLGLLKLSADGRSASLASEHLSTVAGKSQTVAPASANTEHERQVLEGAMTALEKFTVDRRHQSSVTMAIPESRLAEAKERIRKFRRELTAELQRKGKRDSVYQLSISFYPLTNENLKTETKTKGSSAGQITKRNTK